MKGIEERSWRGKVRKGEMHVSVHRTEHRTIVLSGGALSGARVLSGVSCVFETEKEGAPDKRARGAPDMYGDTSRLSGG